MISGTLRHEGARRSRALRAVPPDVHLVPRRGNAGRAPVSRFEVDVTGHYRTQVGLRGQVFAFANGLADVEHVVQLFLTMCTIGLPGSRSAKSGSSSMLLMRECTTRRTTPSAPRCKGADGYHGDGVRAADPVGTP